MYIPKPLQKIIDDFESLPGIGPKTAQRLAMYLLRVPNEQVKKFSEDLAGLKIGIKTCKICLNVSENEICDVCSSLDRDKSVICVAETPLDVLAIEKSGFKGIYHVLHGVINPLAGIGPDEIFIENLVNRIETALKSEDNKIKEIILATNTSLEGESTAMYIRDVLHKLAKELGIILRDEIKITRIGRGLPVGADIEYADESTLFDAFKGRITYDN